MIRVGDRFGMMLVLETGHRLPITLNQIAKGKHLGKKAVLCRCDCGVEKLVYPGHLTEGRTISCGCQRAGRFPIYNTTEKVEHGLSHHPHYQRWSSMMHRCYNEKRDDYARYGGRAIRVAPEWHDPAVYIHYIDDILGEQPPSFTIDRIDNDGDYRPGNIRWADASTQNLNKRNSVVR